MCGSREDYSITGSQDHRVLCKYLASTFWRAKINFQAGVYGCVCVFTIRVCNALQFASCRLVTCATLCHPGEDQESEREGDKHLLLG